MNSQSKPFQNAGDLRLIFFEKKLKNKTVSKRIDSQLFEGLSILEHGQPLF